MDDVLCAVDFLGGRFDLEQNVREGSFDDLGLCRMVPLLCSRKENCKKSVIQTVACLTHIWYHGICL